MMHSGDYSFLIDSIESRIQRTLPPDATKSDSASIDERLSSSRYFCAITNVHLIFIQAQFNIALLQQEENCLSLK